MGAMTIIFANHSTAIRGAHPRSPRRSRAAQTCRTPKATGSEIPIIAPVEMKPPVVAEVPKSSVVAENRQSSRAEGKGEAQHQAIQRRIKEIICPQVLLPQI